MPRNLDQQDYNGPFDTVIICKKLIHVQTLSGIPILYNDSLPTACHISGQDILELNYELYFVSYRV